MRRTARLAAPLIACAVGALAVPGSVEAAGCSAPANEIQAENCLPGSPESEWQVDGSGDQSLQGFATSMSVAQGQAESFKVDDEPESSFRIDIYRLGYYGGDGARRVARIPASQTTDTSQPACAASSATGLVDCGNWSVSATWSVPATAVSGLYLARLVFEDGSGASHVPFVVRDDNGRSDLLVQTSDTTWQAYNRYGGNSLYAGGPGTSPSRAYAVSYNRPFTTRNTSVEDWLFNAEYPMIRWLERNGYDVSYFSGADTDARAAEIREHRVFMSSGHDEYWSGGQRANVEAARDAGVDLAFFSGNEVFWKTRWSPDHRTLICYKETQNSAKIDPTATWTGSWRDPRFSPPADGGRPENALTGTLFDVNSGTAALQVPAADGALRLWRDTSVADQAPGAAATLTAGTLGYEWDEDVDNGFRPAGLIDLSTTHVDAVQKLIDYGHAFRSGVPATHHLTLYRDTNGSGPDSFVFGAGTVQWAWGLDSDHDRGSSPPSPAVQQATVNLLADMGVQPGGLQPGLTAASPSTDTTAPTSRITSAPAGAPGSTVTVTGTASDVGGRVAGVEVSTNGGWSWHPATGREQWSYSYTVAPGDGAPRSRAVDDSGIVEGGTGVDVPKTGGGAGGAAQAASRHTGSGHQPFKPRVRVTTTHARLSPTGTVRLRLVCPREAVRCRVHVRLRRDGLFVAGARRMIAGGHRASISLAVSRPTRRVLRRGHAVRVTAVIDARDAAGRRATTRTRIRLLPPRRHTDG